MPGELTLLRGPGGGGKSALARRRLDAGEVDLQADYTPLHAALRGVERGPDGRYPDRPDTDPAVPLTSYVKAVAVRDALRRGLRALVTSSRPDDEAHWRDIAGEAGARFTVETVDPGRDVIVARLSNPETGELLASCEAVVRRWYG